MQRTVWRRQTDTDLGVEKCFGRAEELRRRLVVDVGQGAEMDFKIAVGAKVHNFPDD